MDWTEKDLFTMLSSKFEHFATNNFSIQSISKTFKKKCMLEDEYR